MSTTSTYLVVDNSFHIIEKNESIISKVSFFVYNYLINPIIFNKSNRISLINYPQTILDIEHKPLDWFTLTKFMYDLNKFENKVQSIDLLSIITDILQSISPTAKKLKKCDIIIISAFNSNYDWENYENKIKYTLKTFDNINLILIDSFDFNQKDNYIHQNNIEILSSSIVNSNMNNIQSCTYTLQDAIDSLTKFPFLVPKFKKPVEIYNFKLELLGISDLEFNISAYPFAKKTSFTDYISSTSIDSENHEKIKDKYQFYYEEENKDNGEIEIKEIQNPTFLINSYKFGTSNLLITDLPKNIFNLNSMKSMIITSFVPKSSIPPWYLKQDSLIIFPSSKIIKNQSNLIEKDFSLYSELWYSMVRLDVVGLVRFVKKNGMDIKYGLIFPEGFIDANSEITGNVDFGCFIFIETIFKDDEKLVNLPNLLKMEVDSKIENEIDNLVDSFLIDDNEKPEIDSCIVSMNNILNNDIFYNLRENLIEQEQDESNDNNSNLLSNTITNSIRKFNNPLMSIERLIYLMSYFVLKNHLEKDGNFHMTLYDMYEEQGIPDEVIKKWLDIASQSGVFTPKELNKLYR